MSLISLLRNHGPPVVRAFHTRVGLPIGLDEAALGAFAGVGGGEDYDDSGNEDGEYPSGLAGCWRRIHGLVL